MSVRLLASCLRIYRGGPGITIGNWNRFHSCPTHFAKKPISGKRLSSECESRTRDVILDLQKLKKIPSYIKTSEKISDIFSFFPFSPDVVENTLIDYPEVLGHDASKVIEFVQTLVECGEFEVITQEEALVCIARYTEILRMEKCRFTEQISNLFGLTSPYNIPWNKVMIASPHSILADPQFVGQILELLEGEFPSHKIRDVIGNNPCIFESNLSELKSILKYLVDVMNVSHYRISMTPNSLSMDLECLELRYQFLSRTANYRHPDPTAKSARPLEASPALHLITETDDSRFVNKCCPGLSLEEFNVFKSLLWIENQDANDYNAEEEDEGLVDDNEIENQYTKQIALRSGKKSKKKKVFRAQT